ncbi:MAG TPA: hypothetical protein VE604_04905 [Candidatus Polarisedimenticolia bacterium]|nr:hypothetical protein [Candidatus Polarisedimenticolia bacterium]
MKNCSGVAVGGLAIYGDGQNALYDDGYFKSHKSDIRRSASDR